MSHISSRDQVPQLLEAYQDLRIMRVKQVQESELNNAALVTHADPEVQKMRDAALGQSLNLAASEQWSDEQLSAQWDEIGTVFGYDAADAAEDWWIKWGALGDISRENAFQAFSFNFQVTQSINEAQA